MYKQFPILEQRINQDASTLSGGEQQMLAMGRALMAKPKLMLLDEPSMGLAPILVKEIFQLLKKSMLREQRFYWLNKMRRWLYRLPIVRMFLKQEKSY